MTKFEAIFFWPEEKIIQYVLVSLNSRVNYTLKNQSFTSTFIIQDLNYCDLN